MKKIRKTSKLKQYQPTFGNQYPENGMTKDCLKSKHCLDRNIFKRIFNKLSNGMQVDQLCTYCSKVIDA